MIESITNKISVFDFPFDKTILFQAVCFAALITFPPLKLCKILGLVLIG
jgi:hypothetical protein